MSEIQEYSGRLERKTHNFSEFANETNDEVRTVSKEMSGVAKGAGQQAEYDTEKSIVNVIGGVEGISENTSQINEEIELLGNIKASIGEIIEELADISEENAASAGETATAALAEL